MISALLLRAQSLSHAQLLVTPWTVAHQSPLSMGLFRQKYWSRLPLFSPEVLPDPGIKLTSPGSPALPRGFFTTEEILISFLLSTSLKCLHPLFIITSTLTTWFSIDWSPMMVMCVSASPSGSEMPLPKASSPSDHFRSLLGPAAGLSYNNPFQVWLKASL